MTCDGKNIKSSATKHKIILMQDSVVKFINALTS